MQLDGTIKGRSIHPSVVGQRGSALMRRARFIASRRGEERRGDRESYASPNRRICPILERAENSSHTTHACPMAGPASVAAPYRIGAHPIDRNPSNQVASQQAHGMSRAAGA